MSGDVRDRTCTRIPFTYKQRLDVSTHAKKSANIGRHKVNRKMSCGKGS